MVRVVVSGTTMLACPGTRFLVVMLVVAGLIVVSTLLVGI